MRMRRKRNLEERMNACSDLLLRRGRPLLNLKEAAENYRDLIKYEDVFKNCGDVELEVGCGNGKFILELSKKCPDTNFLAVEISENVILTALENCKKEGRENVRFLNIPAEILPCYIEKKSISKIYLNFSDPLPEKSRERQRLTSLRFLNIYRALLKEGGAIVQKTDSREFFDYSLENFKLSDFEILQEIRDLENSVYAEENIVTEYEQGFLDKGLPIFCAAVRKRN